MRKEYEKKEAGEENLVLEEERSSRYPQRVLDDIERALAESETGRYISNEEMMVKMNGWLKKRNIK